MNRIAIVTDSAACIPAKLLRKYNVHVLPFMLVFGDRVYRDGVDVTTAQFYHMLREVKRPPTTSQPSIGDFQELYDSLTGEAQGIVSIHVPATLSGTLSAAQAAARFSHALPVRVVDSGSAAMGEGFVVLAAARAAALGANLDQVVQAAQAVASQVKLCATLDTLDYLARSGRVPGVAALAGSVLDIHPVFTLQRGRIHTMIRMRTKKLAIKYMLEWMAEEVQNMPVRVAVFHADATDQADELRKQVAQHFHCEELYTTEFTPVMGAHTGPGVIGLAFYTEVRPEEAAQRIRWTTTAFPSLVQG
jgi:DegV family protein with EDD domain